MQTFEPHPLLRNPHAQTVAFALWPRKFPRLPRSASREFEVEPGTRIRGKCHWQPRPQDRPTLVLVHGLEGSSESAYMLGLAERAVLAGWNAVRLNQRNCGGTESLTPTLYHSGRSGDFRAVLSELIKRDHLPEIFFAGYSMGGNLVLKMAGELASGAPRELRGVAVVCPSLDLAACVAALGLPQNYLYEARFVNGLKARMRRKVKLYPGRYDIRGLARVATVREFDDVMTAPCCGFLDAADYYAQSSAARVVGAIRVPTLVLTAQDDPFVPFEGFSTRALTENPHIALLAPKYGGHCAFISPHRGDERFWAEARVMEFCRQKSALEIGQMDLKEQPLN
jgi:predicted alpha/beta-fold hydrolase